MTGGWPVPCSRPPSVPRAGPGEAGSSRGRPFPISRSTRGGVGNQQQPRRSYPHHRTGPPLGCDHGLARRTAGNPRHRLVPAAVPGRDYRRCPRRRPELVSAASQPVGPVSISCCWPTWPALSSPPAQWWRAGAGLAAPSRRPGVPVPENLRRYYAEGSTGPGACSMRCALRGGAPRRLGRVLLPLGPVGRLGLGCGSLPRSPPRVCSGRRSVRCSPPWREVRARSSPTTRPTRSAGARRWRPLPLR